MHDDTRHERRRSPERTSDAKIKKLLKATCTAPEEPDRCEVHSVLISGKLLTYAAGNLLEDIFERRDVRNITQEGQTPGPEILKLH